ncbi:MAG: hypothetical protein R3E04_05315 [Sphingobium sp.]
MGLTNYQHALRKKYSALTGELEEVRAQIECIHREQVKLPALEARIPKLEALIASAAMLLKDASCEWGPEQSPPVRPWTHTISIPFGPCGRRAMNILRQVDKSMTVREIALEVLKQAGVAKPDRKIIQRTQNAVDSSLRAHRGRGVESSSKCPAQWRSMAKPGIEFDP